MHIIDCDAPPLLPSGWGVEQHSRTGQLEWDPTRVKLHLTKAQKSRKILKGHKLYKELKGQRVLNVCVLDYLLKNQDLIPEEWGVKWVFFWGTIYVDAEGKRHVRYLCRRRGIWQWRSYCLDEHFLDSFSAAVLAS